MKKYIYFLLICLSLVLYACGAPSQAADWEIVPNPPQVDLEYRGLEIFRVDGEWGAIAGEREFNDITWYRVVDGVVELRREFHATEISSEIQEYYSRFLQGTGVSTSDAYLYTEGNRVFMRMPSLGVPFDTWAMDQSFTQDVMRQYAREIERMYIDLCFTKGICWDDMNEIGTRQIVINPHTNRMIVVDYEYVISPYTTQRTSSEAAYREFIRQQLRMDFDMITWKSSAVDSDEPLPTMIAPVIGNDAVPADATVDDLFPVQFMSAIDGKVTVKYATQEQINRMKLGGEDLLAVTRELGVPMPNGKFGFWSKAGIVFSDILFVTDIVGTEYIIGINAIDILGFGETKQLSGWIDTSSEPLYATSVIPQDILASETLKTQGEALAAEGYEKSPAFYVYYDHRHITDVLAGVMHEIQPYRLDNHGSKSLGIVDDYDSVLPIAASSPDANTVEYVNVVTGEKIVWRLQEGGWTIIQGDSCMTFSAVVFNNRNEGIIMPFRFCTSTSGNVIFPVWWE